LLKKKRAKERGSKRGSDTQKKKVEKKFVSKVKLPRPCKSTFRPLSKVETPFFFSPETFLIVNSKFS